MQTWSDLLRGINPETVQGPTVKTCAEFLGVLSIEDEELEAPHKEATATLQTKDSFLHDRTAKTDKHLHALQFLPLVALPVSTRGGPEQ